MKKWYQLYDTAKLPIRIMCFALMLLGIGFFIQNDNVNIFYTFRNTYLILISEICYKTGEILLTLTPLFFLTNFVSKRANSGAPFMIALTGYAIFEIVLMVFSTGNYAYEAYTTLLGISYDATTFPVSVTGMRYPLNTGLIGVFCVGLITRYAYIKSRNRSTYSLLAFVSKDSAALIYVTILSALSGFVFSLIYPTFYQLMEGAIAYIAKDINDPNRLAAYGLLDRFMSMLGMGNLIRTPFWYGQLGGSYQSITGQVILGDVSIWSYIQEASTSFAGCGRFITPYYIINMFLVPSILLGFQATITDRKEKRRRLPFFFVVIVFSIVCGNPLPMELFLLFTAPLLLIVYFIIVMILFAFLPSLGLYLGFSFNGLDTIAALPGSFTDYIINLRDPILFDTVVGLALVGMVVALIGFALTFLYFRFFSYDLLMSGRKKEFLNKMCDAVGGLSNIQFANSSLLRINLSLEDLEAVSFEKIAQLGARRIVETKNGITLDIGSAAALLAREVNKSIRANKRSVA